MNETQQARLTQLTSEFARLKDGAPIKSAADTLTSLDRQAATIQQRVQEARSHGYAHAGALDEMVSAVTAAWGKTRAMAEQRMGGYEGVFDDEVKYIESRIQAIESGGDDAVLVQLETEINALDGLIRQARDDLSGLTSPFDKALSEIDRHARLIVSGLSDWNEFSGERASGEQFLMASDAEWVAGKGRDQAPDGVLYLTNHRLIFERKEKTGKTLGLFGGKKVQEVGWTVDLAQIEAVRGKNAGLLGGKDMLYVEYNGQELTVEVKGRASNEDWAAYIERAKAGEFVLSSPALSEPDIAQHSQVLTDLERERDQRRAKRAAERLGTAFGKSSGNAPGSGKGSEKGQETGGKPPSGGPTSGGKG